RACWGSQSRGGRSQRRSSSFTLQFLRERSSHRACTSPASTSSSAPTSPRPSTSRPFPDAAINFVDVPAVLGVLGVAGESDRIGLGVDGLHRVAILLIDGMGADLVVARRDVAPFLG